LNWELLIKIINQEATATEQQQFDVWVKASPENKMLFDTLLARQQALSQVVNDSLVQGEWERIAPRLTTEQLPVIVKRNYWYRYAAAAAILFVMVMGAWWLLQQPVQRNTAASPHFVIVKAGNREKKKVILPDSTIVWMQYNSVLQYDSAGFNDTSRLLTLNGEAFFDVKQAANKPFRVETAHLKVTVLGTSFNIAGRDNKQQEVTVATGKVNVTGSHVNEILLPRQSVIYDPKSGALKTIRISLLAATAIKDNQLIFEKDNILTIAAKMEKWYNRQVIVKGAARRTISFTGAIKDSGIEDVLEGLGYLAGFTYKINADTITIYPD
jgi:transmembrane sensor